jgi:hypothetical protein
MTTLLSHLEKTRTALELHHDEITTVCISLADPTHVQSYQLHASDDELQAEARGSYRLDISS